MRVDWRSLFSEIHVEWRDRGANCKRGNVNISCPLCGNDPSFHLAISENTGAFYCYRNPNNHSGRNATYVLQKLRMSRDEAERLIRHYRSGDDGPLPVSTVKRDQTDVTTAWRKFPSATESREAVRYLEKRGFDPDTTIARFDLRVAHAGKWSGRILIPYYDPQGNVLTWNGRSLWPDLEPKYKALVQEHSQGYVYVPDYELQGKQVLVLVEGPFDALKIAAATRISPYLPVALCGKQLNAQKLLRLRAFAQHLDALLLVTDSDVNAIESYQFLAELAPVLRMRYAMRGKLPDDYKDPGEMPLEGIKTWLDSVSKDLYARAPS